MKSYDKEEYNSASRSNEIVTKYASIDVITYNSKGLVESIESYKESVLGTPTPENLDSKCLDKDKSVYYTYDSQGNVTKISGDCNVEYSYGNDNSSATTSTSSSSAASTGNGSDLASVIVGTWKDKTGLADISYEFFSDGTGYEYLGKKISIEYTVTGNQVCIKKPSGKIAPTFMTYEDGKLVSGDTKLEKVN